MKCYLKLIGEGVNKKLREINKKRKYVKVNYTVNEQTQVSMIIFTTAKFLV